MNAIQVLKNIDKMLSNEGRKSWSIDEVYKDLGIFDWWVDNLSRTKLKEMRSFLETSISLGYSGYVCFKVGAKYCSHGMWAYKNESKDDYSPEGGCLFHSFRTGDNYWSLCRDDGSWVLGEDDCIKDIKGVKNLMAEIVAAKTFNPYKE